MSVLWTSLALLQSSAPTGSAFFGFEILRPGLGLGLVAVPIIWGAGFLALLARRRARRELVHERHRQHFLAGFSATRARLRVFSAGLAALFFVLSMMGPTRGYSLREVTRRGLDIVVCLDTSRSMLVADLEPNRLGRAQREISILLDHLGEDRVALVGFSGDVRNVSPLTHDRETLRWFMDSVSPLDNQRGGTDIGGALEHALNLFDGRTGNHEAIVLLTDGEDLAGRGLEVAQLAKERGIRIFVVGMGTTEGGKIPADGPGFVRDEAGQEVISKLDDETLQRIADLTGGAYLSAERTALPLEEIHEKRLSRLEGRLLDGGVERVPHDRFQWTLVLSLICMLVCAGMRERRPDRKIVPGGGSR